LVAVAAGLRDGGDQGPRLRALPRAGEGRGSREPGRARRGPRLRGHEPLSLQRGAPDDRPPPPHREPGRGQRGGALGDGYTGPVGTSLPLFAGTPSGFWRSTDWGGRWETVAGRATGEPIGEVGEVFSILAVGRNVYFASDAGAFLSDDFGQTWKKLGLEGPSL